MKLKVNTDNYTIENFQNSDFKELFKQWWPNIEDSDYLKTVEFNSNEDGIIILVTNNQLELNGTCSSAILFFAYNGGVLLRELFSTYSKDTYGFFPLNTIKVTNWMLKHNFYIIE